MIKKGLESVGNIGLLPVSLLPKAFLNNEGCSLKKY